MRWESMGIDAYLGPMASGRTRIAIGVCYNYTWLTPSEARRVAAALVKLADRVETKKTERAKVQKGRKK